MFLRLFFLAFFFLPFAGGVAHAQAAADPSGDEYADVTWPNLARTLVRFNAINIEDPVILNEYSIITACDLYQVYYQDDFKWHKVLQAVLASAKMNIATYPVSYRYLIKVQLGRYDFAAKVFRFNALTKLDNANTFELYSAGNKSCGVGGVKSLPHNFRVVLASPIFLDGIPLSEKDAQTMFRRMKDDGNSDRILYSRLNLRIVYIEPLREETNGVESGVPARYVQSNSNASSDIRLDARLDSIQFYTNKEMTHLVYEYDP